MAQPKPGSFLEVLSQRPDRDKHGFILWDCFCRNCGNLCIKTTSAVNRDKSCGCYRIQANQVRFVTHGRSKSKAYKAWNHMKYRCYTSNEVSRKYHGARGIKVCERWLESFENFLADMGEPPSPTHSLERKDNDLDYSPDNCVWATRLEQSRNRRFCLKVNVGGVEMSVWEAAEATGLKPNTIRMRHRRGRSIA